MSKQIPLSNVPVRILGRTANDAYIREQARKVVDVVRHGREVSEISVTILKKDLARVSFRAARQDRWARENPMEAAGLIEFAF